MNFERWLAACFKTRRYSWPVNGLRGVCLLVASLSPMIGAPGQSSPEPPSATIGLTEEEAVWVKAHPVVRWGLDPRWPPFSYVDNRGQWVGIDVELTRLAAKRAGLNIVLVPTSSWSETLQREREGEIDFLSATATTKQRLTEFDYTEAYGSFPVVIITHKEAAFFTSIHRLTSARVAAVREHVIYERLREDFPDLKLVLTDTSEEALLRVSTGQVDAAIENLAVAGYLFNERGLANLKISGITGYEFPLRFAVRKNAPLLRSMLNKGLATIQPREREIIYATYLHPELGKARDWGAWRRRASYAVVAGAAIGLSFLIWNRTMASQIEYRRAVEAALRQANKRLEQRTQELDARVQEVERLNGELTKLNKDLDLFSASVSHDLRAPVRRMTSLAGLLRTSMADPANPRVQQHLSVIDREGRRMIQLINDLLNFARVGRVTMQRAPVDMLQLVQRSVAEFSSDTQGREIEWHIGSLPEVVGDENLLRQVVSNLVENALKFTRHRARAEIKIDVLPHPPNAKEATFYVQDNGVGFDMQLAESLFSAFRRLHSDAEYEGTGIGLMNVQRIIERHGGRVWAEGAVNQGATFWFTLPRQPALDH
jgi:two-component system, NarL family, sensor histidine kinase EvgS